MKKLRIAWFSPLNVSNNNTQNISAYVSDTLLPLLKDRFEIDLFHDSFEKYPDFPTYHFLQASLRHAENPYDIFFYQLEDSLAVNFIRIHLGIIPGMSLFHNIEFSTDGPEPILITPWQAVVAKYNNPAKEWHDRLLFFDKISSLAHRELAFSIQPIFSSLDDIYSVNTILGNRDLFLSDTSSPLYLPIPVKDFSKANCDFQGLKIAFVGEPKTSYRIHKVLTTFEKYEGKKEFHWLINADEVSQAEENLREYIGKDWNKTVFLHYGRSTQNWNELVKSCNVAIHTYFGSYGNVSPYLQISLAHNVPAIVSNYAISNTLPEKMVYKVEVGDFETAEILEVLNHLQNTNRNEFNLNQMAREHFDAGAVADSLSLLFTDMAPKFREVYKKWGEIQKDAREFLINEIKEDTVITGKSLSKDNDLSNPIYAWEKAFRPVMQELGWLK